MTLAGRNPTKLGEKRIELRKSGYAALPVAERLAVLGAMMAVEAQR